MTIDRLIHTLIASRNEAADDLLLEALDLGNETEKHLALGALLKRATVRGLAGVIDRFPRLPDRLKLAVLDNARTLSPALSELGRSLDLDRRLASLRLIALGRQGRLAYVLLENLGDGEPRLQRAAVEALVALARWVASETRALQKSGAGVPGVPVAVRWRNLIEQRVEVEEAVHKALERQKGAFGGELTRAALLLADHPRSRTLEIVRSARHPGRAPMERRLQQPPASEHVDAFLLAASHAGLRAAFAGTFAHIHERPVLDALLRKSHWLKDNSLAVCTGNIMGGRWMDTPSLARDIARRPPQDLGLIADWIESSGCADVMKDLLLKQLLSRAADNAAARLRILRIALARPRHLPVPLLREFLSDPDPRLRRMAAREVVRRKPVGYQKLLMEAMPGADASVRRVIGRAVGEAGFQAFWRRYDRLDARTRLSAGRAVAKLVPDVSRRLAAVLHSAGTGERIRALQVAREADLVEPLRPLVLRLCSDEDQRVRSKAVATAGSLRPIPEDFLLDRLLRDPNPRVRANAIEVLEPSHRLLPFLTPRLDADNNRERANAIKALFTHAPSLAAEALADMLRDPRPAHRVSALWALRQVRLWTRLPEVGRLARLDPDLAVRRYALGVLKSAATGVRPQQVA